MLIDFNVIQCIRLGATFENINLVYTPANPFVQLNLNTNTEPRRVNSLIVDMLLTLI